MAQIHEITTPSTLRGRATSSAPFAWWVDALLVLIVVAAAYGIVVAASRWVAPFTPATHIDLSARSLPLYAGLSTLRMTLAYLLSLAFSLVYARIAAASRRAERVLVPLLDILRCGGLRWVDFLLSTAYLKNRFPAMAHIFSYAADRGEPPRFALPVLLERDDA